MLFRKKPVVIEAVRCGDCMNALLGPECVDWIRAAYVKDLIEFTPSGIIIMTLEGKMSAEPMDWIIKGVKGEIYPCKPDIFEMTYEAV